eukprot:jgi/Chlat1/4355/Chrsp29S04511
MQSTSLCVGAPTLSHVSKQPAACPLRHSSTRQQRHSNTKLHLSSKFFGVALRNGHANLSRRTNPARSRLKIQAVASSAISEVNGGLPLAVARTEYEQAEAKLAQALKDRKGSLEAHEEAELRAQVKLCKAELLMAEAAQKEATWRQAVEEAQAAAEKERQNAEQLQRQLEEAEQARTQLDAEKQAVEQRLTNDLTQAELAIQQANEQTAKVRASIEGEVNQVRSEAARLTAIIEKRASAAAADASAAELQGFRAKLAEAQTTAADALKGADERVLRAAEDAYIQAKAELQVAVENAQASATAAEKRAADVQELLSSRTALFERAVEAAKETTAAQKRAEEAEQQCRDLHAQVEALREAEAANDRLVQAAEQRAAKAEAQVQARLEELHAADERRAAAMAEAMQLARSSADVLVEQAKLAMSAELEQLRLALHMAQQEGAAKAKSYERQFAAAKSALKSTAQSLDAWKRRAEAAERTIRELTSGERLQTSGSELQAAQADILIRQSIEAGRLRRIFGNGKELRQLMVSGPRGTTALPGQQEVRIEPFELPEPDMVWNIATATPPQTPTPDRPPATKEYVSPGLVPEWPVPAKLPVPRGSRQRPATEIGTGSGREILFQGFHWDSHKEGWYGALRGKATDLRLSGFTTVWLPPPTASVSAEGYMPVDYYDLNSRYGSMDQLKILIAELHAAGIQVLGDVVLNHRCASKQNDKGIWNIFGGKCAWGPDAIVSDDPNFHGKGNKSSGDNFAAAPNIDHSQDFVRKDIKEWLCWLRDEIGYDGWRLDYVRGFWGGFVKEYLEVSDPCFAVGEYWDTMDYNMSDLRHNQDRHRQQIIDWINATGGLSSAFDVTTKGILHAALGASEYWRLVDGQGKPPGVLGWWPSHAVTFLENHDTGSTQNHWRFPDKKLDEGYTYILTHPGTPTVFFDHFYSQAFPGMHSLIQELINIRRRNGIHCRSSVEILCADHTCYAACIDANVCMRIGPSAWSPPNNLHGATWQLVLGGGPHLAVWERARI